MDSLLSRPGHGGGVGGCLHSRTWCWGRGRRRLWMLVSGYGGFMTQGKCSLKTLEGEMEFFTIHFCRKIKGKRKA